MSRVERGGHTFKTGKIGRVNCLRQTMMMPDETANITLSGTCRLEALRERDVMRINAQLATFMTPLRWLWTDWPTYVKEGPDSVQTPPTVSGEQNWDRLGIGSYSGAALNSYYQWYRDNYLRVYNEWWKWPEDADRTTVNEHGEKAVPLAAAWNRCRYQKDPDASGDYTVSATTDFDVRDLAKIQARYRAAMKRDVLSYNRWIELVDEVWNGDGSREVDQVPIMIDNVDLTVQPREIPATDTPGLGEEWMSLMNFDINHQINGITAPEHCIISHFLCLRFAPTIEGCAPLAASNLDWYELVGDPEYLAAAEPVEVQEKEFMQSAATTSYGYLPAGWQWRCKHDVIGKSIDIRDTFPYMVVPTTQAQAHDATRVKSAFRSQALDDYMIDVYFNQRGYQPIGDSMDSYMAGMQEDAYPNPGGSNQEFPKGGKML